MESRLAPATVSQAGTILTVNLDTADESISFRSAGGSYTLTTSNPTLTGANTANFTNNGNNTGTITANGGLTQIRVIDTLRGAASDESVAFADSGANAYSTDFVINLGNDAACDSLTFSGASTFSGTNGLAATVARGNIVSSITSSLVTTGGAPLGLTATAGNIDLLGTVNVSGAAGFTAGGFIRVDNPANALSPVTFTAAGDVSLQTAGAMVIGTSGISGGGALTVTAGGNITQTGIITAPNLATFDSTGGSFTLTLNNAFGGGVGGKVTGTNTFSLTNAGALNLADITLGTGALAVTAGGTISELAAVNGVRAGVPSGVGGGAIFTLTAAGSIILDDAPNNFAGGRVTYAGAGLVTNQALRDVSPLASVAGASFTGNLNATTTVSNVSSFVDLAVGQPITGAGIAAGTTIRALDTVQRTITLSQPATATATAVPLATSSTFAFVAPPSGSFLKIVYDDAPIVMPALTIAGAAGTINLTSGGDILQTGALGAAFGVFSLLRSGSIDLTVAGGNTLGLVSLNDPNADATSAISYTGSAGVTLGNCDLGLGTLSINARNGNVTQADVTFGGSTTNGSTTVTGVTDIAALAVGLTVTRTGGPPTIAPGTTIVAIDEVADTITLSQPATRTVAGATLVALDAITQKRGAAAGTTFTAATRVGSVVLTNVSTLIGLAAGQTITGPGIPTGTTLTAITPTFKFTGNTTKGSTAITSVSSTAGLVVGQGVSGPGIPANSTIQSIAGTTVTISAAATATATGVTVTGTQTVTLSQPATATATGVTLTRVGALTFNVVAGGTTVDLTPATAGAHNDLEGAVVVTGAGVTTFGLDNASTLANLLPQGAASPPNFVTLPATVTDLGSLGITFTNTLALLPNWTTLLPALASLTVTAQGIYQLQGTNVSGNTTTGSKTVTNLSTTTGLVVGQNISGAGIPAGTTITAISTTAKTLTLSQAATATGTAVTLTNGTGVTVTGVAFFGAGNFPILLTNPNNHFGSTAGNGIVLRNSGPNAVVVDQTASAALNFDGGNTTLGNGTFTVNAPGGIAQDLSNSGFRITQAANAGQTLFNTADGAISGSILLNNPGGSNNNFTGITTFNAPQPGFKGTTSAGSNQVTGVPSLAGLSIGQTVTGPGIPIGTTITGFVGTSTVVLNNAATASASGVTLLAGPTGNVNVNASGTLTLGTSNIGGTFTATGNGGGGATITQNPGTTLTVGGQSSINFGTVLFNNLGNVFEPGTNFTGTTAIGSTAVTSVSNVSGIAVGQTVTGPGIPVNTTITAINGPAGTITLSQAATAAGTVSLNATSAGGAISFGGSTSVTVRDSKTTGLVLATTALAAPPPATFLTVFASGPITQSGSLTNVTTATFVAGTNAIILTDPANDFLGPVNLVSTGSAPVAIKDANAIQLGTVQLGTGSFAVNAGNAPGANIIQAPYVVGPATAFGVAGIPGIGITGGITETGPSLVGFTGNTTVGSNTVSNVLLGAGMFGLAVGESVAGPGIPAGTTITAINVATNTVTLSLSATATATGAKLTATGMVFSTARAGATVNLNAFNNDILTPVNANTTNLNLVNLADINLSATTIAAAGNVDLTSTGLVTLPTALPPNFGTFTSSARQTDVVASLTASSFAFNGTTNFAAPVSLTATGGNITLDGNVQAAGPLNFVLPTNNASVNLVGGTWRQGGNNLVITQSATNVNNFNIGGFNAAAVFNMSGGTIQFTGSTAPAPGNVVVGNLGNFEVGANALSPGQAVTVDNAGGGIQFLAGSTLEVGMSNVGVGFTDSLLKKAGATGNISIQPGARLIGTALNGNGLAPGTDFTGNTTTGSTTVSGLTSTAGLAVGQTVTGPGIPAGTTLAAVGPASVTLNQAATGSGTKVLLTAGAGKVLDAAGGIITGFFDRTVDASNFDAAHAFLMGSDVAMPNYDCGILSVVAGSGADADVTPTNTTGGVFTTFNADGDKVTATASNGGAAGLVVVKDVNGDLGIVYRNAAAGSNTLTLATSATPGSGFTTNIAGISVDGPGAVTISAPTVDLGDPALGIGGEIRVQNALAALTLHNANNFSATNPNNLEPYNALIQGGGTNAQTTAIAGNLFANVDINLTSVLNSLTVKQYTTDGGVTAQTIEAERFGTITVSGIPGLLIPGDLNATLVNHNSANSPTAALTSASVAGTLSGYWDLAGGVGTVTAKKTTLWDLGQALEHTFTANTASGSRTLTAISSPTGLVVGQVVTGVGIPAGTTITGITGSTVTLSRPATATAGGVTVTALSGSSALPEGRREPPVQKAFANPLTGVTSLSLGVTALSDVDAAGNVAALSATSWNTQLAFTGNTVAGSSVISNVSDVADLLVGEIVTGAGIPANSAIVAITSSTITLNTAATGTATGVALTATPANASDVVQANSFGNVTTPGNAAIGDIGDMVDVNLIATGNNAGIALGTMTIAGNLDARVNNLTNLVFNNGNVGTITVGRTVGGTGSVNVTDDTAAASGAVATIQAAAWGGSAPSTIAAKSVGTLNVTGSPVLLGDFDGTVFLQGTGGSTGNTLTSFHASNDVSTSTFVAQNGAVGTFTVGGSIANTAVSVLGGAGGTVGTLSAAQWNTGTLVALSAGTLKTTGLALPNPSGGFIAGNLSQVGMNFFRTSGTTPAVGTLSVAGSLILTNLAIRADNGITTVTVGRDVQGSATSIIHADGSLAGSPTVGQITTLTAGRWGTSGPSGSAAPAAPVAISANSLGAVNIKGYTAPELGTANFFPGEFDNSTAYVRGNLFTGAGITSFTAGGNIVADTVDVASGIGTVTVARQVSGTLFREENPLLAGSGKIGTLSAGEIVGSSIQANSVGTLKTTANLTLYPSYGLEGNFNTSDVTVTAVTGIGLGTLSVAGNMASSTMNIGASLTSFTVSQTLSSPFLANGSRVPGDSMAAGFGATSSVGTLTAGSIDGLDLVTNSLTTLTVKGNATAGLAGFVADSLVTVTGNSGTGKTGVGTVAVTGTVSDTSFNVFNGNVGSVTVGAFTGSALLVGFHAVAANDLTEDPVNAAWNPVNFALSSFKTTGPVVTPTSPSLAGTFTDSLIVAARLGTITLPGINTTLPDDSPTMTFGLGFRASATGGGTATIEGAVRAPGFTKNNVFFYHGLAG